MFIQSSPSQNVVVTLKNLFFLLGVKVTDGLLSSIKNLPDYPSIKAISDFLHEINCNSLVVRLSPKQLDNLPCPAVAHLHRNNGHFVVLERIENESIFYIDPEIGYVEEKLSVFQDKWTGVILLIEPTEKTGEINYVQKRREEIFQEISKYVIYFLIIAILSISFYFFSLGEALIYSSKIVGSFISFFLLQKQFGLGGMSINNFCKVGKSDCDTVINSPSSKIFGVIYLSEVSLWFFLGGLFSMIMGAFSTPPLGLIFLLSTLSLPVTLLSIYYQAFKIKKWCPLCLLVTLVLWIEFLIHILFKTPINIPTSSIAICSIGFSVPLVFWLSVRVRFIDSLRVDHLQRSLKKFLKSEEIFQTLLQQQTQVDIGTIGQEPQHSAFELTVVTNPECGPCASAHLLLEIIEDEFKDKITIKNRYLIDHSNKEGTGFKVIHRIVSLSTYSKYAAKGALSSWFRRGENIQFQDWANKNPITTSIDERAVELILNEHATWCLETQIIATPTLFINGKKLPEEYSIHDLRYHLKMMLGRSVSQN